MTTNQSTAMTKEAQAVLTAAIMAVKADRQISDEEIARLRTMLFLSPLFENIPNADQVILQAWRSIETRDEEAIFGWMREILPEQLRETAYAWAAEMSLADGKVVAEEHSFLGRLRQGLELHGELAGKIKAVLAILNRS